MLSVPELAMPRTRKVTTVCNGKKEVWNDREDAQNYFLRQMMTVEARNGTGQSAFIQLIHGLYECSDED